MPLDRILILHLEIGVRLGTSAFGILPMLNNRMFTLGHIEQIVVRIRSARLGVKRVVGYKYRQASLDTLETVAHQL